MFGYGPIAEVVPGSLKIEYFVERRVDAHLLYILASGP